MRPASVLTGGYPPAARPQDNVKQMAASAASKAKEAASNVNLATVASQVRGRLTARHDLSARAGAGAWRDVRPGL